MYIGRYTATLSMPQSSASGVQATVATYLLRPSALQRTSSWVNVLPVNWHKKGANERTRPLTFSLRVSGRLFLGVAGVCKTRIPKPFSFPTVAACCEVLRSRWCQSGVRRCRSSGFCTGAADTSARMHGWSTRLCFLLGGGRQHRRSLLSSRARKYSWRPEACTFERSEST
jgi:hypothetical protein